MGICVKPLVEAMALWAPFEQIIYCSAAEREGGENARSIAGESRPDDLPPAEVDALGTQGQPGVILLLFTSEDQPVHCDSLGRELRSLAPQITGAVAASMVDQWTASNP